MLAYDLDTLKLVKRRSLEPWRYDREDDPKESLERVWRDYEPAKAAWLRHLWGSAFEPRIVTTR